ncbi:AI-2E family transporter [Pseudoclavibacter chungangensis]|uniref:AI-2E family transporter n=1 Tax=Pseudoclavibacter chungangensis TaxID=587635 RepID=A0A7J5C411_9MICO|nr:AI-2E family transporter [Pseudoclavibacter chungangensis]KAB1662520.1 AI-2E family transporter [Pseudoclavibacter chungangensis]NYJ68559.1 putative PurR-regulated permease PerM [Pseudoclavibacter chungangensis]
MSRIGDFFRGRTSGSGEGSAADAVPPRSGSPRTTVDAPPEEQPANGGNAVSASTANQAVAQAAVEANAMPDEGRGHRPAAVGLMWTDGIGRVSLRALQLIILIALGAGVVWAGLQLSIVVIPVLLALIVASAAYPVIKFLTDRRWPSVLATVAVLLVVALLLSGAIFLVVVLVAGQWTVLRDSAVEGFNQAVAWANSTFGIVVDGDHIAEWLQQLWTFVSSSGLGSAASGITAGISSVATFLTSLVLFFVVLFFFMKDGPLIWGFVTKPFRGAMATRVQLMGARAVEVLGGYIRGTVTVALVDALFIGIGLAIVGVPLAFPLAVIVFITAFIPLVGATLAGIVAALVALVTNGLVAAIIVVGIVVLVNQLEGNFLQPVVLGKSLNLHSLAVLLALTIGTVLGGIVGTLLAVPVAAVGWTLVKSWYEPLEQLKRDVSEDGSRTKPVDRKAASATS